MIREAIDQVITGHSLTMDEASQVMTEIMENQATPAQFGAFVTALRLKGEASEEIAGMARVMRKMALPVQVEGLLIDTCGTGGDGKGTFNISTASAFVVAGGGLKVAKHGNRAMSGSCGSADVLETLGVKIDLAPDGVERCIAEAGIGFMFAPIFHPAMRYAAGPRREIGIRTVFNLLGPLTNPAAAQVQVIGIADGSVGQKIANVLRLLGTQHSLIVHGNDGVDELTLEGTTQVWEVQGDQVREYQVNAQDLGFPTTPMSFLKVDGPIESANLLRKVLQGDDGPARQVVLMNSAAAFMAAESAPTMKEGLALGEISIASGKALEALDRLVEVSHSATR